MERVGRARRMNGRMGGERIPNENFDVGVCRIRISSHVGGLNVGHEGREWERSVFTAVIVGIRKQERESRVGNRESGIGNRARGHYARDRVGIMGRLDMGQSQMIKSGEGCLGRCRNGRIGQGSCG